MLVERCGVPGGGAQQRRKMGEIFGQNWIITCVGGGGEVGVPGSLSGVCGGGGAAGRRFQRGENMLGRWGEGGVACMSRHEFPAKMT